MNEQLRDELMSTALDGEPVDVEALRTALETPDGQRTLAAFVLLRAATADDGVAGTGRPEVPILAEQTPFALRRWRRFPVAAAASLGAVALAGSFWLGTTWVPDERASTPVVVGVAPPSAEEPPPTPTRRLEYIPGVDWQAGS